MSNRVDADYNHYDEELEKYVRLGKSGKCRSKLESSTHTNHNDPCGHSRKIMTKLVNSEHNKRELKK